MYISGDTLKVPQIKKLMILNAIKLDIQHKMSPDMYILGQKMVIFAIFSNDFVKCPTKHLVMLSEHLLKSFGHIPFQGNSLFMKSYNVTILSK